MDRKVKPPTTTTPKRRYDASRRQAAARETRRGIVEAAGTLFLARGYAETSMQAIADAAGVALDTVYAQVGTKPVLVRELIERAISGVDGAVPAEERDYVRDIRAEPDARGKIARYARAVRTIQPRLAPYVAVLKEAARGEPQLAALWTEISERRAANMRLFIADLAAAGGLREDVVGEEAADIVWATNGPEFYLLLVEERGWAPERFEHWLVELWSRALLPDPAAPPGRPSGGIA